MRFGEMAALKWRNVDSRQGAIKVRENLVDGEEGRPTSAGSVRDIKMLPPVIEALREWRKATMAKSDYVFHSTYLPVRLAATQADRYNCRTAGGCTIGNVD
jgi:integrase